MEKIYDRQTMPFKTFGYFVFLSTIYFTNILDSVWK